MVKRKSVSYSPRKKKNRSDSSQLTPAKQEQNILNDGLINLYKDEKTSSNQDTPCSEKQLKSNNVENSKTPSREKKRKNYAPVSRMSTIDFSDVGGMDETLKDVLHMFLHYKTSSLFEPLGMSPIRGILLHGPPGCGKSHLVRAIAGELGVPLLEVPSTELVCGISGESENKIREAFETAVATGRCILFIDQIEAISPKRETPDNSMMRRMVNQLITCFDDLMIKDKDANVMVMAATNLPDSIDPALRGGGRFKEEISFGYPDERAREKILEILCKRIVLSPDLNLHWLAQKTSGYVGADLMTLLNHTTKICYSRLCKELKSFSAKTSSVESLDDVREWFKNMGEPPEEVTKNFHFTKEDFQQALKKCVPFSRREGFASVDNVTWDDIGALADVKKVLRKNILWPSQYSSFYNGNNLSTSKGILLFGPKGCGKTLLAKAIANESNLNFLPVSGPELLSMYVGESEKAVRKVFERARHSAPCVIFFDEFDALCPPRSSGKDNMPIERVVNQLLSEACGMQERKQVFLVAATNRLDKIDSAMLRPGRLEKVHYVGLPTAAGRCEILGSLTKNKTLPKIDDCLSLSTIAHDPRCEDFSGADLAYLVREATTNGVEDILEKMDPTDSEKEDISETKLLLDWHHFDKAFDVVKPSISEQDRKYFQKFMNLYSRT